MTGERSIRFAFSTEVAKETFSQVQQFCEMIEKELQFYIQEVVPSYHTVMVYLKKDIPDKAPLIESLMQKWERHYKADGTFKSRKLQIPVCYGGKFGLDMERVVKHTGLTEREIITIHVESVYTVYMIGFLPGFPYLGGLNDRLATPRLQTPRLKVPKGTVGIGGSQTGIYPLECPGGWNIIGKTPIDIYDPDRKEPFFIRTGDQLQFYPISIEEFFNIEKEMKKDPGLLKEFIKLD